MHDNLGLPFTRWPAEASWRHSQPSDRKNFALGDAFLLLLLYMPMGEFLSVCPVFLDAHASVGNTPE